MSLYRAMACTLACLSFSVAASAQTLTLEVELADLETFITNNTSAAIPLNLYGIRSTFDIFNPASWRSISDSAAADPALVTATLGSGALSFSEFITRPDWLIEVNFQSFGIWQPGTRWSIGFPLGTSPDTFDPTQFDLRFRYGTEGAETVDGTIVFIPVPEPNAGAIAVVMIVAASLGVKRRRTENPGRVARG